VLQSCFRALKLTYEHLHFLNFFQGFNPRTSIQGYEEFGREGERDRRRGKGIKRGEEDIRERRQRKMKRKGK
jgi:hypothetical protein